MNKLEETSLIENRKDNKENKENLNFFEEVLNAAHNGIITINKEGVITTCNKAGGNILGIDSKGVVGRKLRDAIDSSYELETLLKLGKPILGKSIKVGERLLLVNISPILEKDEYKGGVAVFQDLDDIQSLFEELTSSKNLVKTLETILENSYEGIVVIDRNCIVTSINKSFARFFDVNPKETIGKHILEISEASRLQSTVETGKIEIGELHYLGKNKMIVMRIPIYEGNEVVGAIGKILFRDIKELRSLLQKVDTMEDELKYYKGELHRIRGARYNFNNIVAESPKRKDMVELAKRAAKSDSTVLIYGDSGTGKELIAHAIHNESLRRYGSFIRINCAAIPAELLEAELFGYEKGAFTGAKDKGKPGKFEMANGGSIFLDEIGDMPTGMQSKLLRVIQEREIERIGSNDTLEIDVRIISATNKNLKKLIEAGKFREDLYYRLNVMPIFIPTLKETVKDIPYLVEKILGEMRETIGKNVIGISKETMEAFMNYDWPGNIRELRNMLERGVNLCDGPYIGLEYLPLFFKDKKYNKDNFTRSEGINKIIPLKDTMEEAEKKAIENALIYTKGNKKRAAELLNIHRSGLYQKLKQFEIE